MQKKFDEILDRLIKLETENETLKHQLKKSNQSNQSNQSNKIVNNGVMSTGNGDINLIVNITPYGKEDISRINRNELLNVFQSGFNSVLRLTETTHFNPKYPEFHNVYISSMKNKYAMMYDGNDWALMMKDDLIDKLYDDKRNYIEENFDDFINSMTKSQIDALHRWMNADDDHPYIQTIKNGIKLMLYNKRNMALNRDNTTYSIQYKNDEMEHKVRKKPKGNIIDPPFRRKNDDEYVKQDDTTKRGLAGRPGTKRKAVVRRRV
jgi:hypothetical protein